MSLKKLVPSIILLFLFFPETAAFSQMPGILPLRERAAVMDGWLQARLDTVVPRLMQRESIDMWILIAREYNEDPVLETMSMNGCSPTICVAVFNIASAKRPCPMITPLTIANYSISSSKCTLGISRSDKILLSSWLYSCAGRTPRRSSR